ncbi:MAG: sulfotransferase family protein [Candidatus Limnocylindria bacterium]
MTADPQPVFIAGLDQSGKTPLRQVLDSSSEIRFWRRSYLWTGVHGRYGDLSLDNNLERCLRDLGRSSALRDAEVDLDRVAASMRAGPRTYARLFGLIGVAMAHQSGKTRWGVQEGGVEERAHLVFDAFPAARVLHMVRDPRDLYLATTRRPRAGQLGISMDRWQRNVRRALANARRYDGRYLILRYEDLMQTPVETCLRVGQFIAEPMPERLSRAAVDVTERRRSRSGVRPTGRYRKDMPKRELRFAERRLRRELRELGYPILGPRLSATDWIRYAVVDIPLNDVSATAAALAARAGILRVSKLHWDQVRV